MVMLLLFGSLVIVLKANISKECWLAEAADVGGRV